MSFPMRNSSACHTLHTHRSATMEAVIQTQSLSLTATLGGGFVVIPICQVREEKDRKMYAQDYPAGRERWGGGGFGISLCSLSTAPQRRDSALLGKLR
jgi:hypothetical protein